MITIRQARWYFMADILPPIIGQLTPPMNFRLSGRKGLELTYFLGVLSGERTIKSGKHAVNMNQQPPIFYKNPGLAAVLSFFYMGLGQVYNGQIGKGIAFIVAYTISIVLIFVVIGIITTPILFIYGMYDAYKSAENINRDLAQRSNIAGPGAPPPVQS